MREGERSPSWGVGEDGCIGWMFAPAVVLLPCRTLLCSALLRSAPLCSAPLCSALLCSARLTKTGTSVDSASSLHGAEWTLRLPRGEEPCAVACGDGWVALATCASEPADLTAADAADVSAAAVAAGSQAAAAATAASAAASTTRNVARKKRCRWRKGNGNGCTLRVVRGGGAQEIPVRIPGMVVAMAARQGSAQLALVYHRSNGSSATAPGVAAAVLEAIQSGEFWVLFGAGGSCNGRISLLYAAV